MSWADARAAVRSFAARLGRDRLVVQGAGGNISFKSDDSLWVKASGRWLADAEREDIFAEVDLASMLRAIETDDFDVPPTLRSNVGLRPSIETSLHALMPQAYVCHVHAIEPLVHLVRRDFASTAADILAQNPSWAVVPYGKPGPTLAKSVAATIRARPEVNVLLLQNHGVVVAGSSLAAVEQELARVVTIFAAPRVAAKVECAPIHLSSGLDARYSAASEAEIKQLACNPDLFSQISRNWALYPDHLVFLGAQPALFDSAEDLAAAVAGGRAPKVAFVRSVGVFFDSPPSASTIAQLLCYFDVMARQPAGCPLQSLTESQVAEILDWDMERYRQGNQK